MPNPPKKYPKSIRRKGALRSVAREHSEAASCQPPAYWNDVIDVHWGNLNYEVLQQVTAAPALGPGRSVVHGLRCTHAAARTTRRAPPPGAAPHPAAACCPRSWARASTARCSRAGTWPPMSGASSRSCAPSRSSGSKGRSKSFSSCRAAPTSSPCRRWCGTQVGGRSDSVGVAVLDSQRRGGVLTWQACAAGGCGGGAGALLAGRARRRGARCSPIHHRPAPVPRRHQDALLRVRPGGGAVAA